MGRWGGPFSQWQRRCRSVTDSQLCRVPVHRSPKRSLIMMQLSKCNESLQLVTVLMLRCTAAPAAPGLQYPAMGCGLCGTCPERYSPPTSPAVASVPRLYWRAARSVLPAGNKQGPPTSSSANKTAQEAMQAYNCAADMQKRLQCSAGRRLKRAFKGVTRVLPAHSPAPRLPWRRWRGCLAAADHCRHATAAQQSTRTQPGVCQSAAQHCQSMFLAVRQP